MVEAILKNGDKIKLPTTFDDGVQIKIIGQPAPLMGMGLSKLDGQKVVRQVDTDDHFIAAVMYDRGAFQKGLGNVSIKPGSVTASEITTDSGEPVALADSGYTAQLKIAVPAMQQSSPPVADPQASKISTVDGTFEPSPALKITTS